MSRVSKKEVGDVLDREVLCQSSFGGGAERESLLERAVSGEKLPTVKVVILNWNGVGHLEQFLPSVVENTPSWVDVVVADNGSEDNSLEWLSSNYPDVEQIKLDKNYGYAGGYNRALESPIVAGADYYILLNSDVETPNGWCEPLIELMEAEPDVAAVAPKILSYNEPSKFEYAGAAGGFIDGLGYPFCRGRIMSTLEQDRGQYDDSRSVFWATGACLCFRTSAWRELGGLDSDFFAHMEEIDLCWRAQLMGYSVMVEPQSVVYHLGGGTLSASSPYKTYLNFRNTLAMMYKNLSTKSLVPTMFVRMVLDGVSALLYLVSGKPKLFSAVFRSHIHFWRWRPQLKQQRKEIQSHKCAPVTNIYRGSIVLRYLFGGRTFGNLL